VPGNQDHIMRPATVYKTGENLRAISPLEIIIFLLPSTFVKIESIVLGSIVSYGVMVFRESYRLYVKRPEMAKSGDVLFPFLEKILYFSDESLIFTDHLGFARNIPDGMVLTDKLYSYVAKIALLDVVNFWNVFLIF
jgi:hypothetical protein